MLKWSVLISISLLILCLTARANPKTQHCIIRGQLMDSVTNKSVAFGTVDITTKANPKHILNAVITGDNGRFQFSVSQGVYMIHGRLVGKRPVNKIVVVRHQPYINVGHILMQDMSKELSEVVVSAQKPLVKVDLDKISYSLADDPESKTSNVLDMMRKVPMITIDGDENIQLKGSTNFKIYLNGKPSNMITNNPKDVLKSMPASAIQSIQVITDPGAKYDAEGASGIINIVTKKESSLGGYVATLGARASSKGGYGAFGYGSFKYGKFGLTANYGYHSSNQFEDNLTDSYRENKKSDIDKYLHQNGSSKPYGNNHYSNVELSYELDSLNLIDMGANIYAHDGGSEGLSKMQMQNQDMSQAYQYNMENKNISKNLGLDYYFDYQHMFQKKNELLTFSYRMNSNPSSKSQSENIISDASGQLPKSARTNRQYSTTNNAEHTFQLDYTNPISKTQNIETGAKYIMRPQGSISGYDTLNNQGDWDYMYRYTDNFKYNESILAAYGSYGLNINRWGAKAGVRYEETWMSAKYIYDLSKNFKDNFVNLVPSATVTYKITDVQNLRLGYNMRISRPGIKELNPYRDNTNPNYITQGNSNLVPVQIHNFNLNYGLFSRKINLNANLFYAMQNNGIQSITSIINDDKNGERGASYTTYENIGKFRQTGLSIYFNWNITDKFRFMTNMGGTYTDVRANDNTGLANYGFAGNVFGMLQYKFPHSFRMTLVGGHFGGNINIQGRTPSFNFNGVALQKDLLKDRLSIQATLVNPFQERINQKTVESTDAYYYVADNQRPMRQVRIAFSYRFGGMKAHLKKAKGINNDDKFDSGSGASDKTEDKL